MLNVFAVAKLIDIGCMQINQHWHSFDFASLSEMFDPARNVKSAARFLKILRSEEGSWTLPVARYNAGPNNPAAERAYVCAVSRHIPRIYGHLRGQSSTKPKFLSPHLS